MIGPILMSKLPKKTLNLFERTNLIRLFSIYRPLLKSRPIFSTPRQYITPPFVRPVRSALRVPPEPPASPVFSGVFLFIPCPHLSFFGILSHLLYILYHPEAKKSII